MAFRECIGQVHRLGRRSAPGGHLRVCALGAESLLDDFAGKQQLTIMCNQIMHDSVWQERGTLRKSALGVREALRTPERKVRTPFDRPRWNGYGLPCCNLLPRLKTSCTRLTGNSAACAF
eukprot:11136475-Karenia_brevis.AAC.1